LDYLLASPPVRCFPHRDELRTLASGWIFLEQDKRELTLLWTVSTLFFLLHGGGAISVDHLLIGREFWPSRCSLAPMSALPLKRTCAVQNIR